MSDTDVIENVGDIIKDYLKRHGFDGLFAAGECACEINDLCPCSNDPLACEPGIIQPCEGCDKAEDCSIRAEIDCDGCIATRGK